MLQQCAIRWMQLLNLLKLINNTTLSTNDACDETHCKVQIIVMIIKLLLLLVYEGMIKRLKSENLIASQVYLIP